MAKLLAPTIHPTAVIHPNAQLGEDVEVAPYAVIGEHVTVGRGTAIGAHAVLDGWTTLGEHCQVFTGAVIGSIPQDLKYQGEPSQLKIGHRNQFREYVTINPGTLGGGGETVIGDDNLFMAYSHVAHDCRIGDHCVIANSVALAGHIILEDRAVIGGLSGVHQFVRVGTMALIGGCSKVVQDIPPYALSDGHPAKVIGLNSEGLRRAKVVSETRRALKQAFGLLFESGLTTSHALERIAAECPPLPELTRLIEFIRGSKRGIAR